MGIGSWLGLWFGLSIPAIVVMYLLKRKFIDTLVPSHLLWNRVLKNIEANRPWQKLQNRLLMWLQLLVAALLVFALMQPFVWVEGGGKAHVVIVADTSGSMSAMTQGASSGTESSEEAIVSRLELLKQNVKQYIEKQAKDSEVTLLAIAGDPNVVVSREKDHHISFEAVDQLEVYYGKAAYNQTLSLASALTREEQDAEVVIFTDGQWQGSPGEIAFDVPAKVIQLEETAMPNLAIKQFGIQVSEAGTSGVTVIGSTSGAELNESVSLLLYGDDVLLKTETVELSSGQNRTVTFDALPDAEVYRATLDIKDGYAADNTSFAFGKNNSEPEVLLLTPGNLFLEKALQLSAAKVVKMNIGEDSQQGKGTASSQEDAPPLPVKEPDLIIVEGEGPSYLQQGEWQRLLREKPLWTIGGDGSRVKIGGEGLKPLAHPVTNYLSLEGVYVASVVNQALPAWGESIINAGGKSAVVAGYENGYPRLDFLFSLEETDLPLSAEFPILVNNALGWLSGSQGTGLGRVKAGDNVDVPLPSDVVSAVWTAKGGLAQELQADPLEIEQGADGFAAVQRVPSLPGLYALELTNQEGEMTYYWLESSGDSFESELGLTQELVLSQAGEASQAASGQAEDAAGEQRSEAGSFGSGEGRSPYELAGILAAVVLLLILLEWGVYQRGHSI